MPARLSSVVIKMVDHISSEKTKPQEPPEWIYTNVEETSKNARRIYILYLTFLAYCSLTIFGTSDRDIILNSKVFLPIIGRDVSLYGFFILAPVLIVLVFLSLQIYVHRLKGIITDLQTNYPAMRKRNLYPWIINMAEEPDPGIIGSLQQGFSKITLWISMPLVLTLFALWILKKHDQFLSYFVGITPLIGTAISTYFWHHYENIGSGRKIASLKRKFLIPYGKFILFGSMVLAEVVLLFFIIPRAQKGELNSFCVDLSYQTLVQKPIEDYRQLYWSDLKLAQLQGANLRSSVLRRANLLAANLEGANLSEADLGGSNLELSNCRQAIFWGTNLQGANLSRADFQRATFMSADFRGAIFFGSDFRNARLQDCELQGVRLSGAFHGALFIRANLQGADFRHAIFDNADFDGANLVGATGLTVEQLSKAKTLYNARLDLSIAKELLKLKPELFTEPEIYRKYKINRERKEKGSTRDIEQDDKH